MKKIFRAIWLRLFGIDPYHKPKPIKYTGIWKVTMPEKEQPLTSYHFNKWFKEILRNEKSKIQR